MSHNIILPANLNTGIMWKSSPEGTVYAKSMLGVAFQLTQG